ncbi:hypothetical protein GQ53DRAFT_748971 [Thozetella sp. PMI_491]|nr:hypothetical protein GQ53DRAFT_748971 [Thozetella sp. PMI_491]
MARLRPPQLRCALVLAGCRAPRSELKKTALFLGWEKKVPLGRFRWEGAGELEGRGANFQLVNPHLLYWFFSNEGHAGQEGCAMAPPGRGAGIGR